MEAGYTFFNHADIYGDTTCETIFGEALAQHPAWRDQLVVATKCGILFADEPAAGLRHRYDFSCRHIVDSAEASLRRLQMDRIDLLMLHRPDYLADPAELTRAFSELRAAGKVRESAAEHETERTVIALAWLLRHPSKIVPVIGSTNPANIRIAAKATDIELDRPAWYRILQAARGEGLA